MSTYTIRRVLVSVLLLFIVTFLVFFTIRLLPGDPILMIITASQQQEASEEYIAQLKSEFGLDKHILLQYVDWLGQLARGDLGVSIINRSNVGQELLRRLPITLHLGGLSLLIGLLLGIPAGIICAARRARWMDTVVTTLSNIGITIPNFWLGILLIYVFGLYLGWLPTLGYTAPFEDFWLNTKQIIMPVICLSVFPIASIARQVRSSMLEVMHQDYIRTAWAKGLRERIVLSRHALKNALIPIVTLAGMQAGLIIGGSVFIESVFNIPGIGRLAATSVLNRDYPYVQGVTLLIATSVVLINFIVDLSYGWLDPRIRYK